MKTLKEIVQGSMSESEVEEFLKFTLPGEDPNREFKLVSTGENFILHRDLDTYLIHHPEGWSIGTWENLLSDYPFLIEPLSDDDRLRLVIRQWDDHKTDKLTLEQIINRHNAYCKSWFSGGDLNREFEEVIHHNPMDSDFDLYRTREGGEDMYLTRIGDGFFIGEWDNLLSDYPQLLDEEDLLDHPDLVLQVEEVKGEE